MYSDALDNLCVPSILQPSERKLLPPQGLTMEDLRPYAASDRQREILDAVIEHGSHEKAAKALGCAKSTVWHHLEAVRRQMNLSEVQSDVKLERGFAPVNKKDNEGIESRQTQDGFLLTIRSFDRIQTAAEAMAKAGINEDLWMPVEVIANSWEVACRLKNKTIKTFPLWQVKVKCRRRVPESIEKSLDGLASRIKDKFEWQPVFYEQSSKEKHKLVIGLVDHHFGKLCWGPEVGGINYDIEIARRVYAKSIASSVEHCRGRHIDEIVLPIGNDLTHIDNRQGTTANGTPQDRDSRYEKMSDVTEMSVIDAVATCRQVAPVRVVWVKGNHDPVTSMWLCKVVQYAFYDDEFVTVDLSPSPTKYLPFGKCLLGFAHGDGPKEGALKDLMQIERPDEWARARECREWITGHFHQQKRTERISTFEQSGIVYRILPSLTPPDSWHYHNGFSMSRKATESYLYSHDWGMCGYWQVPLSKLMQP